MKKNFITRSYVHLFFMLSTLLAGASASAQNCNPVPGIIRINSASSGSLGVSGYNGKIIELSGTLTINTDFTITNCRVRMMTAEARIEIAGSKTLNISSSNLFGCWRMWDGIYINPACSLNVNTGTTIEDAMNAIVSKATYSGPAPYFNINGAKLNKNNISILVESYDGNHPGIVQNT